jgi:glycosyltransferase involved in cell wall biosynthesis
VEDGAAVSSGSMSGAALGRSDRIAVIQVVSGLEIADGGPSYSIPRLHRALRQAGIEDRVFADQVPGEAAANNADEGVVTLDRQFGRIPLLRKLHISAAMERQLLDPVERIDLVHSHGLWRFPNIYAGQSARRRQIPHMVSPRGMLSTVALGFSRLSKRLFWAAGQGAIVREAACVHATSPTEYEEIRAFGIPRPIAILPNGVDMPPPRRATRSAVLIGERRRTLLYFGRIHPQKGLDFLLAAWATVAPRFPSWSLRIVGPGERGHVAELKRQIAAMGLPRAVLDVPVYGDAKWEVYRSADLFALPTLNENFGLTVVESLACRRPVIVTKGAPWSGVVDNRCGWWINTGKDALTGALRIALATPDVELDAMGQRGEAWVREAFSWDSIGRQMADVYRWVLGRGNQPGCVVLK